MTEKKKILKNNPFRVPENYFEELESRIIERKDSSTRRLWPRIYSLVKPHILMAAAMTGFVIISYTGLKLVTNSRNIGLPEIGSTEYSEILLNDLEDYILINSLTSVDDYELSSKFNNDEIIDYLINEDIEYFTIIENL